MEEVKMIFDLLEPLCYSNNQFKPHALFRELPHMTWDNYFSGDDIFEYAASHGFGLTMTCRRDRLPSGINSKYLHKEKTDSSARPRAARFLQPIFCIKQYQSQQNGTPNSIQLTSFQSTSSCNIIHVNAINSCGLYCSVKERGRGVNKRRWGIEMNESRRLYLNTYGAIDKLDHLIENCDMGYR